MEGSEVGGGCCGAGLGFLKNNGDGRGRLGTVFKNCSLSSVVCRLSSVNRRLSPGDDLPGFGDGFFQIVVNYNIVVFVLARDFVFGGGEAAGDGFGGVLSAAVEAGAEGGDGGRTEEDGDGVGGGGADLAGALGVYFQEDVVSVGEGLADPLFGGAVEVSVDLGGFQKESGALHALEVGAGGEKIFASVVFAGAGGAGCVGDGDGDAPFVAESPRDGGFSASGRGGEDEKAAGGHWGIIH